MAKPRIQIEKLKHYESFVWLDFRKFDKSDKKFDANIVFFLPRISMWDPGARETNAVDVGSGFGV